MTISERTKAEIQDLVLMGMNKAEIARVLNISEKTVVRNIAPEIAHMRVRGYHKGAAKVQADLRTMTLEEQNTHLLGIVEMLIEPIEAVAQEFLDLDLQPGARSLWGFLAAWEGRVCPHEALYRHVVSINRSVDEMQDPKIVAVYICKIRQALKKQTHLGGSRTFIPLAIEQSKRKKMNSHLTCFV